MVRGVGADAFGTLDALFGTAREIVATIAQRGLFGTGEVIVTAGGSMYFDRVISALSDWSQLTTPMTLVLRSGCYVSHDAGEYELYSPLAGRRDAGEDLRLRDAVRLWGSVLSRPEPDIVIVGVGLRDAPVDREPPIPLRSFRDGTARCELHGRAQVDRMMDPHAFVRIDLGG